MFIHYLEMVDIKIGTCGQRLPTYRTLLGAQYPVCCQGMSTGHSKLSTACMLRPVRIVFTTLGIEKLRLSGDRLSHCGECLFIQRDLTIDHVGLIAVFLRLTGHLIHPLPTS